MSELSSYDEDNHSDPGLFTNEEILQQMGFNDSFINTIEVDKSYVTPHKESNILDDFNSTPYNKGNSVTLYFSVLK